MKGGDIFIRRIKDEISGFPEVLKIDIETGVREVDLSHVENVQTNSVASSNKRIKSENEASAREFEIVRRRAINSTSCRRR